MLRPYKPRPVIRHSRFGGLLRIIIPLFFILIAWSLPSRAYADSPIVVTEQTFRSSFPNNLRFTVAAQSTSPIEILRLTVWQKGVALGSRFTANFRPDDAVRTTFVWDLQYRGSGEYMPPGARGEYTWHVEDSAGNQYDTPHQTFEVVDASHQWRTLSNQDVAVNWYSGDNDFGVAVLERAITARAFLTQQLAIDQVEPIKIFVYADRDSFFNALPPTAREWTGGSTFPEYGVILINFTQDNLQWGLRATSHELSHAVLHARVPGFLGELVLPRWLDEGLAVYNETIDHAPDDSFEQAFRQAIRQDLLIPLRRLDVNFPADSQAASLAYGEGYSAVKFMIEKLGADKFAALLNRFEGGTPLEDALRATYAMVLDELENAWRQDLGLKARPVTSVQLPTVGAMPTYAVSSGVLNPTPLQTATPTATPAPTRISQSNAAPSAPQQAPLTTPESGAAPPTGLCGGVLAFGGLVAFGVSRKRKRPHLTPS